MGRGRGKGKKLTVVTTHEDTGSSGEVIPTYRRRGRPHKPMKEETDGDDSDKIEVEEGEKYVKANGPNQESEDLIVENGKKKRRRFTQLKENDNSVLEENGTGLECNHDDSTIPNGFRPNGSRRKSKPRRAAEAGVECN